MNLTTNAIQSPAFSGTFLIPYSEMANKGNAAHETMRQIGAETVKYAKPEDMKQAKDGIDVKIDDSKEKEYQAVIAKYGVNVKKVDVPTQEAPKADSASYSFMIGKLHPQDAQAKIEKFEKMNEEAKGKEFIAVYQEFKQSPYSQEKPESTVAKA